MSSTNSARRGFTLVEVLVSVSLVAMFFGILYGMFLPVLGVASAGSAKTDTLGGANSALYQLEEDLRVTSSNSVTVGTSPTSAPPPPLDSTHETTVLAIEQPVEFANTYDLHGEYIYDPGTGLSEMESYVVWDLIPAQAGGGCSSTNPCALWRTTVSNNGPTTAVNQISSAKLANAVASIKATGKLMVSNVTSFEIGNQIIACAGCNPVIDLGQRPEIDIEMATQSQDQSGHLSQTSFVTQVFARNT